MHLKYFICVLCPFYILSCRESGINDESKRNENWIWWVDKSTRKGEWISAGNRTSVKDGEFTIFYYNGLVYSQGKLKDGSEIDTTFYFNFESKTCKYIIHMGDSSYNYYPVNGPYTGMYYKGGKREEGVVENNKPGDRWTWYFPNGRVS